MPFHTMDVLSWSVFLCVCLLGTLNTHRLGQALSVPEKETALVLSSRSLQFNQVCNKLHTAYRSVQVRIKKYLKVTGMKPM